MKKKEKKHASNIKVCKMAIVFFLSLSLVIIIKFLNPYISFYFQFEPMNFFSFINSNISRSELLFCHNCDINKCQRQVFTHEKHSIIEYVRRKHISSLRRNSSSLFFSADRHNESNDLKEKSKERESI